jgi:RpiB/LacA/LacB family sugar-phosphate isomerase
MRIHLAYDHATFAQGKEVASLLGERDDIGLVVHGPNRFDDGDDYPQFTLEAALAVVADHDQGIDAIGVLLGSSPVGVVIAANKVKGVRAVLGHEPEQLRRARRVDDCNALVLAPDTVSDVSSAVRAIDAFAGQSFDKDPDDVRRIVQIMEFETSGTIAGWQVGYAEALLDAATTAPGSPQAWLYREFGGPAVLTLEPTPEAHPGPGQVRVVVKAVGLNPIDVKLRSGLYPPGDETFPRGTAQDFAGIVDEVAPDASYADGRLCAVGDRVLGWTDSQGAAATHVVVPATNLARKPDALAWDIAGALQTAALTAQASLDVLGIAGHDVVLVSAAAGGVGLVYAQLAMATGAVVIGTAGESNQEFLSSLGIVPVTYGPDLAERVRRAHPASLTAVQDNHGREAVLAGLELGVPPERIVAISDHAAVTEFGLASPGRYHRSAITLQSIADAAAAGRLRLPVEAFRFDQAAAAYQRLETGHGRGKVALRL